MFAASGILVYLAIKKKYEMLLLIPIGFGIVPANFLLTEIGPNVVGIIGSTIAAGVFLTLLR